MKVLFSLRHPFGLRNFEPVLRELHARGHRVRLSFLSGDKASEAEQAERLASELAGLEHGRLPSRKGGRWSPRARRIRVLVDALRYRLPAFDDAPKLRARARRRLTTGQLRFVDRWPWRWHRSNRFLTRFLTWFDAALPPDEVIAGDVREYRPDLIVVSPLVDFGSEQVDYVKVGRELGVPIALAVNSWDNLTNKGLIRLSPDRVYVWNPLQLDEAVAYHGIEPERIVVTGAPIYDRWFGRRPSRDAAAFKTRVGLDPSQPYILYMCSSPFIADHEAEFVDRWLTTVRRSEHDVLRSAGILIRPHPENRQPWGRMEADRSTDVAIWPPAGASPVDGDAAADYFDSMYHSSAVVGVNSSGLIEAGIVGRRVCTLLDPSFADTQRGTLHFRYLVEVGGGLLSVAHNPDEHAAHLAEALDAGAATADHEGFVRAFVRPHGLDVPGTPQLVDGLLALAEEHPRRARPPGAASRLVRAVLAAREGSRGKRRASGRLASDAADGVARAVQSLREADVDRILVGPWLDGPGLEALYWLPFLARVVQSLDRDRLVAMSSGGVGDWYRRLATDYVEILDYMPPAEFVARNRLRIQGEKPLRRRVSELDREIVRFTKQAVGAHRVRLLHPSLLFDACRPFWSGESALSTLAPLFAEPAGVDLRDAVTPSAGRGVALRLVASPSFPDTAASRELANRLARALRPVVDGPSDAAARGGVAARARAIASVTAWVGSDPEDVYLAASLGVESVLVFVDEDRLQQPHLARARQLAGVAGAAVATVDARAPDAVERVLQLVRPDTARDAS